MLPGYQCTLHRAVLLQDYPGKMRGAGGDVDPGKIVSRLASKVAGCNHSWHLPAAGGSILSLRHRDVRGRKVVRSASWESGAPGRTQTCVWCWSIVANRIAQRPVAPIYTAQNDTAPHTLRPPATGIRLSDTSSAKFSSLLHPRGTQQNHPPPPGHALNQQAANLPTAIQRKTHGRPCNALGALAWHGTRAGGGGGGGGGNEPTGMDGSKSSTCLYSGMARWKSPSSW